MNSRAFTLSLIIAGFAMFMVYSYMQGMESEFIERYGKEGTVVVAKRDINEYELLDDTKVTTMAIPQKFLAPGHFKKMEEVNNTIATVAIKKGEQITKPRVTYPGGETGLSRQVSSGKRAFSISVSEDRAVGKLIKPGDRVDILGLIDYAGGRKDLFKVKTILQDVLILSTGLSVTNSIPLVGVKNAKEIRKLNLSVHTNYRTVTLELDPYQTQKLILLMQTVRGGIYLTLRNNDDKKMVRIKGTRFFDLLEEDQAEAKTYFQDKLKRQERGGR